MGEYEILKDDEVLSITENSRQYLLLKYKRLDEVSAKSFYVDILKAITEFISVNKAQPLEHLKWLLNKIGKNKNNENLQHYYDSARTRVESFNPIILACKSKAIDALRSILMDKKKTIFKLACKIHNKIILPNDEDKFHHSAFYYAVRSNMVDLLDILILQWPDNYLGENQRELDSVLSKSYKELKLRNVLLKRDMELYVQTKIFNIRFFHKNPNDENTGKSMDHTLRRIDLVIENIQLLQSIYWDSDTNEEFLLVAEFIAKNIHVLKSDLKSTYDKIPWEEVEFFLTIFIEGCKKNFEVNLVYNIVLQKERFLLYLKKFSNILEFEKENVANKNIGKLGKKLVCERHTIVERLIQRDSSLQDLYADYDKVRDFCSLETIKSYTSLAVSADVSTEKGKLIITRALQVTGEHIKNKLYSPKLSSTTANFLLSSLPQYTKDVIKNLRECLSHRQYLLVRSEIENKTYNFFKDMQNDILNLNCIVTEVLSKIKGRQLKNLLLELKPCKCWRDVKDLLAKYFFSFESIAAQIEQIDPDFLLKSGFKRIQELLLNFLQLAGEKTAYEKDLFEQIMKTTQVDEDEYKAENEAISLIIRKLSKVALSSQYEDLNNTCDFDSMDYKLDISNDLYSPFPKIMLELIKALVYSVITRIEPENNKLSNIGLNIFYLIEFETGKVKWIKEYSAVLSKQKHKKIICKDVEVQKVLMSKISLLNSVLKENKLINNEGKLLKQNINLNFHYDRELLAVFEMLVLDICSLLEDSFTNNNYFLDNNYIVQTGRNLRNNLAHANSLINDLSPLASLQILMNALKLATENFTNNCKKIGLIEKCDLHELEINHRKNLFIVRNQKTLFHALSEGNMENFRISIEEGADIFGRDIKLRTCLHFSSMSPNVEIINYLLKQGLDINCSDSKDQTALHVAVKFNRFKIVELLLKESESINKKDTLGKTPLHIAVENNNPELVKCLLKYKCDVSYTRCVLRYPPLHYAILKGNTEVAEVILKNETNVDEIKGYGGFTALFTAAEKGDTYLLRLLLRKKANIHHRDDFRNSPLHIAALNSNLDAVKILYSEGIDINTKNVKGDTPLHAAAKGGSEEVVNFLLHNMANISAENHLHLTPLHHTIGCGHLTIAELFLMKDSTLANAKNCSEQAPLHMAAYLGHEKLVKLLLKFNAEIDSRENTNSTALHISVSYGHLDVIKSLVEGGADIEAVGTVKNCKPIHVASLQGHFHVVEYLILKGADIHSIQENTLTTSLEISVMKGHEDIVKLLITKGANFRESFKFGITPFHFPILSALKNLILVENKKMNLFIEDLKILLILAATFKDEPVIKFCLKMGCNINSRYGFGLTALHLAALNNHKDVVNLLLDNGADIDAKDDEGATALHYAARRNGKDTVRILINKQCGDTESFIENRNKSLFIAAESGHDDILNELFLNCKFDIVSLQQYYPFLHSASQFGHRKVVESLVEKGFDVNASWQNRTPLHYATIHNHCEIARLLISKGAHVNAQDIEGMTALHFAAEGSNVEMVQILLNGAADVSIRDKKNRSVAEVAVKCNKLKVVKLLFQRKDDSFSKKCDNSILLHISAEIGSLEITEHLILKGANMSVKDMNGSNPIHIAAEKGHKEIVEFYLDKNIDINDLGQRNFTPLHFAALGGRMNVCECLIERGADVNAFAENDITPIHLAAVNSNEEVFRILLHNGAYYNICETWDNLQISEIKSESKIFLLNAIKNLFIAVKNGKSTEVELRIKEADFHQKYSIVNAMCVRNGTPLLYASREGYVEVVEILLKLKANPNICDKHKLTPLHYACKFSHLKIVKELLKNGAMYNGLCSNRKPPLEYATDEAIVGLLSFANKLFNKIEDNNKSILKDLKDAKNEEFSKLILRAKNRDGNTLVAAAILSEFSETQQLKELFQEDVNQQWYSALDLINQNKSKEASEKLKTVLERRIEIFGEENPATLQILEKLALEFFNQRRHIEALELFQEIHSRSKNNFGEYHPKTLKIRFLIPISLNKLGKRSEAYELLKEVSKYKKALQRNNSYILYSDLEMSSILIEMGNFAEALKISYEILDICKNEHDAVYNEITLQTKDKIATILSMLGNFPKAKEMFEEIYNNRKYKLPSYHPLVLQSRSNIATLFYEMKKYDESLRIFKDMQNLMKHHYPPNHLLVLMNESGIARIIFNQGMPIRALKTFLAVESEIKKSEGDPFLAKKNKKDIESVSRRLRAMDCEYLVEIIRIELEQEEAEKEKFKSMQVDTNSQDEEGRTTLHIAVDKGEREQIESLLKNGADIFSITKEGRTVLHFASAKGRSDIVEFILNHANQLCENNIINVKDTTGSTALHLVSNVETAKCLLKHGAIYNVENYLGQTPLELAADEKIIGLLKRIDNLFNSVQNGANIIQDLDDLDSEEAFGATKARNCQGFSLLQVAIAYQRNDLAQDIGNWLKKKICK